MERGFTRVLGWPAIAIALAAGVSALLAGQIAYSTVDYRVDAGGAIHALVNHDIERLFADEPQMGLLSIVLRWPFAAASAVAGGGTLNEYRFGLFACLLVVCAVAMLLLREMLSRGAGAVSVALVVAVWLFNSASLQAINIGHPEELVGAALCVAAVIANWRWGPLASGVALGLALATKEWALVAILPVVAGSRDPLKTLATAFAVWLPFELPLIVLNYDAYVRLAHFGVAIGTPSGVWWPLLDVVPAHVIIATARAVVLIGAFALSLLVSRRSLPREPERQLALLTLVLLGRAIMDPTGNEYFLAPFLFALTAYEALSFERPPILSLGAATLVAITFHSNAVAGDAQTANALFLLWTIPAAIYLYVRASSRPCRLPARDC